LDLSFNDIEDLGILYVIKGLEMVKEVNKNGITKDEASLETLNIKGISLRD